MGTSFPIASAKLRRLSELTMSLENYFWKMLRNDAKRGDFGEVKGEMRHF